MRSKDLGGHLSEQCYGHGHEDRPEDESSYSADRFDRQEAAHCRGEDDGQALQQDDE